MTEHSTGGTRVVIADDHPVFRSALSALLKAWGWDVLSEAADGNEVIEAAREFHPEVVVTDYDMPELDGIEAARTIKARWPEIRVVILTGSDDEDNVQKAMGCGVDGYVIKTAKLGELESSLGCVLRGEPVFPSCADLRAVGRVRQRAG